MTTRLGRSKGIRAFATPPTWDKGGRYRTLVEQGRTEAIARQLNVTATMVGTNGRYSQEMYEISRRIFGSPFYGNRDWTLEHRGQEDFDMYTLRKVYDKYVKYEMVQDEYIPVRWYKNELYFVVPESEALEFARGLMDKAGKASVPTRTFALRSDADGWVLYARKSFLEMFKSGLDIINCFEFIKKANEKNNGLRRKKKLWMISN